MRWTLTRACGRANGRVAAANRDAVGRNMVWCVGVGWARRGDAIERWDVVVMEQGRRLTWFALFSLSLLLLRQLRG